MDFGRHSSHLHHTHFDDLLPILKEAGQDLLILVWRNSSEVLIKDQPQSDDSKLAFQSYQGEFSAIYQEEQKCKCQLEIVLQLQGHENWMYGLHWQSLVLKGSEIFGLRVTTDIDVQILRQQTM